MELSEVPFLPICLGKIKSGHRLSEREGNEYFYMLLVVLSTRMISEEYNSVISVTMTIITFKDKFWFISIISIHLLNILSFIFYHRLLFWDHFFPCSAGLLVVNSQFLPPSNLEDSLWVCNSSLTVILYPYLQDCIHYLQTFAVEKFLSSSSLSSSSSSSSS